MQTAAPAQYDMVELIDDVIHYGTLIPSGTRGTIVDLQGTPVKAYTVEFDHKLFGEAFLPDLEASQFRILRSENQ
ncbi:hypothetical protein [Halocynthiibacter styelae]|uniref:DUF4926 domain-containing protein n=1 Tax=Halocynthiibacter styelae TaxID=2761955 RepID=A0A8J7LKB4_9RHOB|nr:hypothetical protein [Paenihalocynthiibacter styelae]MBI1492234.1 hypothetical protein [Paenihalocynthiibacter styelae]